MGSIKTDKAVMTYQDKLIAFVKLKDKFIFKETKIHYINKKDIDNIKTWSDRVCRTVYNTLKSNVYLVEVSGLGSSTCVWCIQFGLKNDLNANDTCPGCFYGENHGYCDSNMPIERLYDKLWRTNIRVKLTNSLYRSWMDKIEKDTNEEK